jgi:hypothetical protein
VIASPPGWGPWTRPHWTAGVATHVVGLLIGAIGIAWIWWQVGGLVARPPLWALGVLALVLALTVVRVLPLHLEGSPWRVPRSWGALGHAGYSGVFGAALGTGLATALASPALYLLIAWGIAAPSWSAVWPIFLAFGIGRAAPFIAIAVKADRDSSDPFEALERVASKAASLAPAEAFLLAFVGGWLVLGG